MFTDRVVVMKYWNRVEIGMHAYKKHFKWTGTRKMARVIWICLVYRGKTEEKWRWRDLRKIPGNYAQKWSKDIVPGGHWKRRPAIWVMSE